MYEKGRACDVYRAEGKCMQGFCDKSTWEMLVV